LIVQILKILFLDKRTPTIAFLILRPKIDTMRGVLLIIPMLLLIGCNSDSCRDAVDPATVRLEVQRLEEKLFNASSSKQIEAVLQEHPDFAQFFLHADQYPADSILANRIYQLTQNPSIDTLYKESLEAFSPFNDIVNILEVSLGRLSKYYPQTTTPVVQTAVTGLYNDLFISNDHIMIGMDFFIGEGATYKPKQIPDYILRRYDTEHLPANIMQFISSQYIKTTGSETMLDEMIDYGKSYYLLSKILPCTPERILIGYTEEEWNDSFENDAIIWANFVENKLLYETDHNMKQKFLGERPNVFEIGDKCPGRIGRWLGWQIVKNYAEKNNVSVTDLMAETDSNKIFSGSRYKPSGG